MNRPDTDAEAGTCTRALAQRATSVVDARSRRSDPFVARPSVAQTLANCRSRDPNTSPGDAIVLAIEADDLVAVPRPRSGRPCLTVRDARRIAACHGRYKRAGESVNVHACEALLAEGLPSVLDRAWVVGP